MAYIIAVNVSVT
jgi:AGZA family xanthine/uracil permease-like MFS transporter